MALIECDECGRQLSSDAKACPHCGKNRVVSHLKRNVMIGLFGCVAVFVGMGIYTGKRSSQDVVDGVTKEMQTRGVTDAEVSITSYRSSGNLEFTCGSAHYKGGEEKEQVMLFYAVQERPMMDSTKITMGDEKGFFDIYQRMCMN